MIKLTFENDGAFRTVWVRPKSVERVLPSTRSTKPALLPPHPDGGSLLCFRSGDRQRVVESPIEVASAIKRYRYGTQEVTFHSIQCRFLLEGIDNALSGSVQEEARRALERVRAHFAERDHDESITAEEVVTAGASISDLTHIGMAWY